MRQSGLALIALVALVASPLAAQSTSSKAADTNASHSAKQQSSATASLKRGAESEYVTGTIVSVNDTRIEVKVESVSGLSASATSTMTGRTENFTLSTGTDQPANLRVGERVNVWFESAGGVHMATRIGLAAEGGASSAATDDPTTSASGPATNSSSAGQASTATESTAAANTASSTNSEQKAPDHGKRSPSSSQTNASGKLPQTASDLPLVGVIGLGALGAAVVLRFAFKA
jgi:hypothetical protein